MEFVKLRAYVDGVAGNGEAESFSKHAFDELVKWTRWLAGMLFSIAFALAMLRSRVLAFVSALIEDRRTLRTDRIRAVRKLKKYSSRDHKKVVFGILFIGIVLRLAFLFAPVTYDEAFTYVHYISKPFSVLLSDHSNLNNHIFHNVLAKFFTSILGSGTVPLRLTALIFGILFMPLVYLFTRLMFNRYIAITTLALVAGAGGFIEYSALARGYSITWVCFTVGLLLGRYFLNNNNLYVMVLLGLVNAIGLWAVPTMIYPALSIYIWIFIGVVLKFDRSLKQRTYKIFISIVVMTACSAFLYLPPILTHGVGQLFSHPSMGDTTWVYFIGHYQDQLYSIWSYINHASHIWISFILIVCAIFAVVISSKFRVMAIGAFLAIVPMVLIQSVIGPPKIWNYALVYIFISGGIGMFYFLKLVQSKVFRKMGKRTRTIASGYIIILACGYLSFIGISDRIYRMHESDALGSYFNSVLETGDRVFVTFPIEAQLEYEFLHWDIDMAHLYQIPEQGSNVYVLVNTMHDQTLMGVLDKMSGSELFEEVILIEEKGNTSIYKTTLK